MASASISRRSLLRFAALASTSIALKAFAAEDDAPSPAEQSAMDALATDFIAQAKIPGFSVAFAHRGQLAYAAGYGFADTAHHEPVTPQHLFRIASISKPFTSTAIYTLVEQGKLTLDDIALGPHGILSQFPLPVAGNEWLQAIQVRHLLTHTSGGWQNDAQDPTSHWRELNQHDMIAKTLKTQPLLNAPGTHFAYSNFGYCLLGRVIEARSGKPYEDYVRQHVLEPSGITAMRIGGMSSNKKIKEVTYYGPGDPYRIDPARLDSNGGWIASPTDLVNFLFRVDGFPTPADILQKSTEKDMTTASSANPHYAKGWAVNPSGNYWHNGGLPGTSSMMVRTKSGMCWAGIANSRPEEKDHGMDPLLWKMARCVPKWQA